LLDGRLLGAKDELGTIDGSLDGTADGFLLAKSEGLSLGDSLGNPDGWLEACPVGDNEVEGLSDDWLEG
jgi:hypothetical protein